MILEPKESAIVKTLVYFDLFDYPLTFLELAQNMCAEEGLGVVNVDELETMFKQSEFLKRVAETRGGFYFLKGREEILRIRAKRYAVSLKKIQRAQKFIFFLRFLPWIQGAAICNSLSYFNAQLDDDLDFFILVKPGFLWLTRFWAIVLAEILGHRPKTGRERDGFCLSFFAVSGTSLESLRLKNSDPYFDWWLARLLPIYGEKNVWQKFWQDNMWLKKERPFFTPAILAPRLAVGELPNWLKKIFNGLFSFSSFFLNESMAKKIQEWRLPANIKNAMGQGTAVVLSEQFLKFHFPDKREEYREKFERRLKEVIEAMEFRL